MTPNERAALAVPCSCERLCADGSHLPNCASEYQEVVADQIRAAEDEARASRENEIDALKAERERLIDRCACAEMGRYPWLALFPADPDEQDDPYAPYRAWERWMEKLHDLSCDSGVTGTECTCPRCELYHAWDDLGRLARGELYAAMTEDP